MKCHLELMAQAFAVLESLPQAVAFDIFSKLDRLSAFPQMGSPLGARFPRLNRFRQIIYKGWLRIIYEFDEVDETVYILAIQDCRRKMPTARELDKAKSRGDMSIDE